MKMNEQVNEQCKFNSKRKLNTKKGQNLKLKIHFTIMVALCFVKNYYGVK